MYIADINGSVNKVEPDSDIVYSLKKKLGDQAVEWVIPSPSENKFAIVRKITQTKRELFITYSKGRKAVTLAKCTQIFGSSWSPNSDTLAFSVISEDKGERGLFVVDVKSKKITQLSTDLDEVSGPITWSPSGNKLLVSKVKNNKNEFVAYVLTLKK
jgi:TolB protein